MAYSTQKKTFVNGVFRIQAEENVAQSEWNDS